MKKRQSAVARRCATPGQCRITGAEEWISQIGSLHREQLEDHFARLFGEDVDVSDIVEDGKIVVRCVTYKELLAKYGRTSADWVLIDAEGHDEHILRSVLSDADGLPYVLAFEHAHFDDATRDEIYEALGRHTYYIYWINDLDMV